jgi:hypothetical protein
MHWPWRSCTSTQCYRGATVTYTEGCFHSASLCVVLHCILLLYYTTVQSNPRLQGTYWPCCTSYWCVIAVLHSSTLYSVQCIAAYLHTYYTVYIHTPAQNCMCCAVYTVLQWLRYLCNSSYICCTIQLTRNATAITNTYCLFLHDVLAPMLVHDSSSCYWHELRCWVAKMWGY